jgi:single-stranded DNA-specific DHH superfamily exonuclease
MLNNKQIKEIKSHLEKAQNPLFLFDNDVDGLCSFLLLARYIKRGRGVAVKSFPDLDKSYIRKVNEFKSDYVFVLDKHAVSEEFFKELKIQNIPCVWIDHHEVDVSLPKDTDVYYYNPMKNENISERKNEPTTYLAYQVVQNKKEMWLAFIGCLSDGYVPDFIEEFRKNYPDLLPLQIKTAFEGVYNTEIGKISRVLNFALKDRTSNVVKMIKYLLKLESPVLILEERENNSILQRFNQINKKYLKILEKAKRFSRGKLLFFQYGGDLSISSDLSNELSYIYPEKVIVVAYLKSTKANVSLRGENVRKLTLEAIKGIENATGGGHENATGATLPIEDLLRFKEKLQDLVRGN